MSLDVTLLETVRRGRDEQAAGITEASAAAGCMYEIPNRRREAFKKRSTQVK